MGGRLCRIAAAALSASVAVALLPAGAGAGSGGAGVSWQREPQSPRPQQCPVDIVWTSATAVLVQDTLGQSSVCNSPNTGAVLDLAGGSWRPAAALPDGTIPAPDPDSWSQQPLAAPVGGDGFGWLVGRRVRPGPDFLLRYSAAADRWDVMPQPPAALRYGVEQYRMIAAGPRLVLLDVGGDAGHVDDSVPSPAGAVLEPDGHWQLLPPDPFRPSGPSGHRARTRPGARDGVWTGTRLLMTARTRITSIEVAALDLAAPGSGAAWTKLPAVVDVDPLANPIRPVLVAGRVVWNSVVYDPTTGTSRKTPIVIRDRARTTYLASVPNGLVLGDRIVLEGEVFEPVSGAMVDFPGQPDKVGPLTPQGSRWTGGPYGILRLFGGICAGVPVPVELVQGVGYCVPVNPYLLRADR